MDYPKTVLEIAALVKSKAVDQRVSLEAYFTTADHVGLQVRRRLKPARHFSTRPTSNNIRALRSELHDATAPLTLLPSFPTSIDHLACPRTHQQSTSRRRVDPNLRLTPPPPPGASKPSTLLPTRVFISLLSRRHPHVSLLTLTHLSPLAPLARQAKIYRAEDNKQELFRILLAYCSLVGCCNFKPALKAPGFKHCETKISSTAHQFCFQFLLAPVRAGYRDDGQAPRVEQGRGLHSSTLRLNVSTFGALRWVHDFTVY